MIQVKVGGVDVNSHLLPPSLLQSAMASSNKIGPASTEATYPSLLIPKSSRKNLLAGSQVGNSGQVAWHCEGCHDTNLQIEGIQKQEDIWRFQVVIDDKNIKVANIGGFLPKPKMYVTQKGVASSSIQLLPISPDTAAIIQHKQSVSATLQIYGICDVDKVLILTIVVFVVVYLMRLLIVPRNKSHIAGTLQQQSERYSSEVSPAQQCPVADLRLPLSQSQSSGGDASDESPLQSMLSTTSMDRNNAAYAGMKRDAHSERHRWSMYDKCGSGSHNSSNKHNNRRRFSIDSCSIDSDGSDSVFEDNPLFSTGSNFTPDAAARKGRTTGTSSASVTAVSMSGGTPLSIGSAAAAARDIDHEVTIQASVHSTPQSNHSSGNEVESESHSYSILGGSDYYGLYETPLVDKDHLKAFFIDENPLRREKMCSALTGDDCAVNVDCNCSSNSSCSPADSNTSDDKSDGSEVIQASNTNSVFSSAVTKESFVPQHSGKRNRRRVSEMYRSARSQLSSTGKSNINSLPAATEVTNQIKATADSCTACAAVATARTAADSSSKSFNSIQSLIEKFSPSHRPLVRNSMIKSNTVTEEVAEKEQLLPLPLQLLSSRSFDDASSTTSAVTESTTSTMSGNCYGGGKSFIKMNANTHRPTGQEVNSAMAKNPLSACFSSPTKSPLRRGIALQQQQSPPGTRTPTQDTAIDNTAQSTTPLQDILNRRKSFDKDLYDRLTRSDIPPIATSGSSITAVAVATTARAIERRSPMIVQTQLRQVQQQPVAALAAAKVPGVQRQVIREKSGVSSASLAGHLRQLRSQRIQEQKR